MTRLPARSRISTRNPLPLLGLALCLYAGTLAADPRIREIDYDDRAVVRLEACFGFQTMIEFGADERIENVGLGEAAHWLVVPNKRGNLLFLKPAYRVSHSNMTVATDRRRYSFELVARDSAECRRGRVVYDLRFRYADRVAAAPADAPTAAPVPPPAAAPPVPSPPVRNAAYSFSGARENVPRRVFDDGQRTWFQWGEGTGTPAVYALAGDGTETLVGFTSQDGYLVADQVAPAFALRRGKAQATLFNDGYHAPALDAQSPQPRPAPRRRSWFGGRGDAR